MRSCDVSRRVAHCSLAWCGAARCWLLPTGCDIAEVTLRERSVGRREPRLQCVTVISVGTVRSVTVCNGTVGRTGTVRLRFSIRLFKISSRVFTLSSAVADAFFSAPSSSIRVCVALCRAPLHLRRALCSPVGRCFCSSSHHIEDTHSILTNEASHWCTCESKMYGWSRIFADYNSSFFTSARTVAGKSAGLRSR